MRTTIELPDSLFRSVKLKATEQGLTLKEFVVRGMEQALASGQADGRRMTRPPVAKRVRGKSIPARSNRGLAELLEASGEGKF
jgi:hypothetical protein